MRRLIFTMMIAVLLLRGWAGDAMATQMAAHAIANVDSISVSNITGHDSRPMTSAEADDFSAESTESAHAAPTHPAVASDCLDHSVQAAELNASGHCEDCSACQACHTVAVAQTRAAAASVIYGGTTPTDHLAQFASAIAAPGQKPPIS